MKFKATIIPYHMTAVTAAFLWQEGVKSGHCTAENRKDVGSNADQARAILTL